MDQQLNQLFDLRWDERNRALQKDFLRIKQEMNARGLLNSSMTIENGHRVLIEEFRASRNMIARTILDHIKNNNKQANASYFLDFANKQLIDRKEILERKLESCFDGVISGLQNKLMIAPFRSLEELYQLEQKELVLEINEAISTYNRSFGGNLTEQLKNRFLNNPILAIVVLSLAGGSFIVGALRFIGVISF